MTESYAGPDRRAAQAVTREEFDELKREVHVNTQLTADIHAMVRSFKIMGAAAKVIAAIAAALTALWHAAQALLKP